MESTMRRVLLFCTIASLVACGGDEKSSSGSGAAGSSGEAQTPVEAVLSTWCEAQTSGDLEAYSALYAKEFKGVKRSKKRKAKTYDHKAWLKDRGKMFKKPLHVDCRAPKVIMGEDDATASITFEQYWRSPTYADQGDKRIDLKKTDAGWVLVGEEMLNSEKWDTKKFRDGTAAPTARFKTDETKVKIPEHLKMMTTRRGPPCYRKCLKQKPKDWKEVTTTNHDENFKHPSEKGCEIYCIEMHGNYE